MKKLNDPLAWISEDEESKPIGIEIDVEKVIVKNRKREADEKKVNELVESIKEIGLISPICVNRSGDDYILIAGLHRLTAYKKLGINRIPAKIADIDDIHSELAEIDENLVRAELHYLDRAEILKRRQEIYEELHPETKAEEKRKIGLRNHAPRGETVSPRENPHKINTFVSDTAKKTGLSERAVQQDLQIAKNFNDDVKKQIKEKKISKGEALKIARLKKEDQQKAIDDNGNISAKEIGKKSEQKNSEQEIKSIENKIESFNGTHTDIVLEIGKPKDIKSHMLPLMAEGEPPVIKIAFKSKELANDLIDILSKSF